MGSDIIYPTWNDVGVPKTFIDSIKRLGAGELLDYLVLNRVMRYPVKVQYVYKCKGCSYIKRLTRAYEDYSICENCDCASIQSSINWRMGKDKILPFSQGDTFIPAIVQRMAEVYAIYFRCHIPEDFLKCDWEIKQSAIQLPKISDQITPANLLHEDYSYTLSPSSSMPLHSIQFCCGELAKYPSQAVAICRAAVLCPFLWDELFDWRHYVKREFGKENHIFPLLNIWNEFINGKKKQLPRLRRTYNPNNPVNKNNINDNEDGDGFLIPIGQVEMPQIAVKLKPNQKDVKLNRIKPPMGSNIKDLAVKFIKQNANYDLNALPDAIVEAINLNPDLAKEIIGN